MIDVPVLTLTVGRDEMFANQYYEYVVRGLLRVRA